MKITKRQLKRIITKKFLQLEQFDTGSAGDEVGGTTLEQKKEQCEKAGGEWVSDDPSGKYGHCSVQIKEQRNPRFDDDYDPLNPDDDEDDAAYDQGYDDGFNGYPSNPVVGGDYHVGYEEGVNAAKDEDSRAEDAEEFGPHSPGMMGPPRREGKVRLTKRQLRRIIKEEVERLSEIGLQRPIYWSVFTGGGWQDITLTDEEESDLLSDWPGGAPSPGMPGLDDAVIDVLQRSRGIAIEDIEQLRTGI